MAKVIPKLITDTEKYFQYEGSIKPTTQDELQAFMKNEHSIVECLTDELWQPETVYEKGHTVKSPNMPKGFHAVALVGGTTFSNEPDWGDGSQDITDGSLKWKLTKGNITVNGVQPDSQGNITIPAYTPVYASQGEAVGGIVTDKIMSPKTTNDVLENIGYWKPNELVTVGTIRFLKGTKYAGYYLQCTQQGTTGTTEPIPAI